MAYQLKDPIDLTRHVRTSSGVKRYHLSIGSPIGKHLPGSMSLEAKALNVQGVTFEGHVQRLDELMHLVQTNEDSETVDENAWAEVTARLEAMQRIAKVKEREMSVERRRAARATEAGAAVAPVAAAAYVLKEHAPKKAVALGKEWVNESAAHTMAMYAANFAASAASLIGAQSSTHFVEAFEHILENPAVEIGFTSAAALLISALIARIRKALKDRKDRKIAAARGEVWK